MTAERRHDRAAIAAALDTASVPAPLRAEDGVDAGAYTVSEPLTVEEVRMRAAQYAGLAVETQGLSEESRAVPLRLCHDLYREVLMVYAADRGPLGDLARAALGHEGRTPEAMLAYDRAQWPGGCMVGFMLWINAAWRAWATDLGFKTPSKAKLYYDAKARLFPYGQDHFDLWLAAQSQERLRSFGEAPHA